MALIYAVIEYYVNIHQLFLSKEIEKRIFKRFWDENPEGLRIVKVM